jgi:ribonucleoside-diphosphate reductase alpha chain
MVTGTRPEGVTGTRPAGVTGTRSAGPSETRAPAIPVEVVEHVRDRAWVQETDAPPCHECGTLMVRNGACHKCPNCGSTSGCS